MYKQVNNLFDHHFIKYFIIILTSVYAGYTLQPVPAWINYLFDNSHVFKFMILFLIGLSNFTPFKNNDQIYQLAIVCLTILIIFYFYRKLDPYFCKKEKFDNKTESFKNNFKFF